MALFRGGSPTIRTVRALLRPQAEWPMTDHIVAALVGLVVLIFVLLVVAAVVYVPPTLEDDEEEGPIS